ncbi:MAG: NUDIX domain-containing protein [Nitrospira sp.]|nr:MAG: NUDIX domain-containing protein [Nitrospira sp.]
MIPLEQYKQILAVLPILCVDVIITNSRGEYLLVKRKGEPLKGQWWVIGGRVLKGETLEQAVVRKVKTEVGLTLRNLRTVGYYEEVFPDAPFQVQSGFHGVSVVFMGEADDRQPITLDGQSAEWTYAKALPAAFRVRPFLRTSKVDGTGIGKAVNGF